MFLSSPKRPLDIKTGAPEAEQVSSINKNFQMLYSQIENLSNAGTSPLLLNHPISKLNAARIVASNNKKEVESVNDLTNWIKGTKNKIVVKNIGNGKIQINLPDNVSINGILTVLGLIIANLDPNSIVTTDADSALDTPVLGTVDYIPKFTTDRFIGDSSVEDDGATVIVHNEDMEIDPGKRFYVNRS